MNRDHLLALATMLEGLTLKQGQTFDLDSWGYKRTVDCHTSGCAVGWACCNPEFRKQGLGFDLEDRFDDEDHPIKALVPTFEGYWGWDAVCEFFEIDLVDAEHLFLAFEYQPADRKNPLAVATRIRKFVEAES